MNTDPRFPKMRYCNYDGKLDVKSITIPVEGDEPIRVKVCGQWLDCGLIELGVLKNTV